MMPFNMQSSKMYVDSALDRNLESRQGSRRQQNSKTVKERVPPCHENQNLNYHRKLKVKTSIDPKYSDLPHELRREADGKISVQPTSSGNNQLQYLKGKTTKDDELVKYMSNLPGYLKRMDGEKNPQDKVLNVGVLDWARLEKWKQKQKCTQGTGRNNVSATSSSLSLKATTKSSTSSAAPRGATLAHQREHREQHPSVCPYLNSSHKGGFSRGVKPSEQKVLGLQDLETSSESNLRGQIKMLQTNRSFDRNNAAVTPKKERSKDSDWKIASERGNFSTNLRNCGVALSPKEKGSAWDGELRERVKEVKELNINRTASDLKIASDMGASHPKSRNHGESPGSKGKTSAGYIDTEKKTGKQGESNVELGAPQLQGKLDNIVLLLPKELSQKSSPKESTVPMEENWMEANQNSLSGGSFSPVELLSAELTSDIPHSCPLPSKLESKIKPKLMAHSLIESQSVELSSDVAQMSPHSDTSSSILSKGKDAEHSATSHMNANGIENLKILNEEMAEMAATRSRNPSPNRRFSFSLSRMSRSFSWKESSAVPQLSSSYVSVKSGPVKSEDVSCLDDSNRQKVNGHNRARSSPLRRILDPLLRSKSSNPVRAAETVHPLKGSSSNLNFNLVIDSASLQNEKHELSRTQALVQLTIKNEVPLFKFVVDNNDSVLVATMKNLTSGKDDSGQHYTFYSVNEIKRKGGGWISQGSKQKSRGFVYNVVGQMVSSSYFSDSTGQNLKNQFMVRESVLFGVEQEKADQASQKIIPSNELAAVVEKMSIECRSHSSEQSDEDPSEKGFTECLPQDECPYISGENHSIYSTTFILPGAVHGLPNKGAPSSLIKRWKSGGLCDCGGWDLGCKLRILANHDQRCGIPASSSQNFGHFELFEGGAEHRRPIFSLVSLNKEIYSVEFNPSISLLQAFFFCVTVISSQRSSQLPEVSHLCEAKVFQEESMKNPPSNNFLRELGKAPAKYAPNPPHSPVGRV